MTSTLVCCDGRGGAEGAGRNAARLSLPPERLAACRPLVVAPTLTIKLSS